MSEAHDELFAVEHLHQPGLGLFRGLEAFNQRHGLFIGAAVQRAAQRADARGDGRIKIRQRRGGYARGEGRSVEFMFGVKYECGVQRPRAQVIRQLAQQQAQKMGSHGRVIGFGFNPFALAVELVPVQQHRRKSSEQAISHLMLVPPRSLRLQAAERGSSRAQHVHRVRVARHLFQGGFQRRRQAAQRHEFLAVAFQFRSIGQMPVQQEERHLFKSGLLGQVLNGITAISQAHTLFAYGTDCCLARHHAGQSASLFICAHSFRSINPVQPINSINHSSVQRFCPVGRNCTLPL